MAQLVTLLPSISADFFLASVVFLNAAAFPPIGLLNWLLTTNSADFTFTNSSGHYTEQIGFDEYYLAPHHGVPKKQLRNVCHQTYTLFLF